MDRLNGISMSASMEGNGNDTPWLPPGFRFHPTDEELLSFYLASKIHNPNFSDQAISEADLNKCEPWELPGKARMGEKEWYFYSLKDRKYPTGVRTNRATQAGYWKATGKDREVMSSQGPLKGKLIGMKKTLVFYQGRAPKGTKSNWVMHEYRAEDALKNSIKSKSSKDEWVLCRVFHKTPGGKKMALIDLQIAAALINGSSSHNVDARIATMAATLPGLREVPWNTPTTDQASLACSQMSGQNMLGHPYASAQAHIPGQSAANMYLPGQCLSGQGASSSYATGLAGQNQLSSLLSSIQRGHESGNPLFKSLFQHYREQQVKVERKEDCHVAVMEELEVEQRAMNLQVPVTMWGEVEVGGQNVNTMVNRGRLSPDSSVSTLECAPSPHFHSTNYMHHPLTRLPSDLESLWLYPDQLA